MQVYLLLGLDHFKSEKLYIFAAILVMPSGASFDAKSSLFYWNEVAEPKGAIRVHKCVLHEQRKLLAYLSIPTDSHSRRSQHLYTVDLSGSGKSKLVHLLLGLYEPTTHGQNG